MAEELVKGIKSTSKSGSPHNDSMPRSSKDGLAVWPLPH
jgi:hypothetical protein